MAIYLEACGTALDVGAFGTRLMTAPPDGPRQHLLGLRNDRPDESPHYTAHRWHRKWDQDFGFGGVKRRPFFRASTLITVKKASATIASVICRYQPCQWRTS